MKDRRSVRAFAGLLILALLTAAVPTNLPAKAGVDDPASFFIAESAGATGAPGVYAMLPGGHRAAVAPGTMRITGSEQLRSDMAIDWSLAGAAMVPLTPSERLANDAIVWSAEAIASPNAGVPAYGAATQAEVYPGIDARYTLEQRGVSRVLTAAPGARTDVIALRYASSSGIVRQGDTALTLGAVRETLAASQLQGGKRQGVDARLVDRGNGTFGIALGDYDRERPVEIALRMDLGAVAGAAAEAHSVARLGDHPLLLARIPDAEAGDYLVFQASTLPSRTGALASPLGVQKVLQGTVQGGDKMCQDVILADGDVVDPTIPFSRVGRFIVPAGVSASVLGGTASVLDIQAIQLIIAGTLNLGGAGFAGGPSTPATGNAFIVAPGSAGSGPGAGGGAGAGAFFDEAAGGGGAGYGGVGGNGGAGDDGGIPGLGGPTYGMALPPGIQLGSGGGSGASDDTDASGAGGSGGGAIDVLANQIIIDGALVSNGSGGGGSSAGAGGGGSGGGILLDASQNATGTGLLAASGGGGGSSDNFGGGGGGGGGGRIKFAGALDPGATWSLTTSGGGGGSSFFGSGGAAGQPGTINSAEALAPDPNGADVSDCGTDLSITKTADPHPIVIAGNELIYRITVTNNGPNDAFNVVVSDTLPAEVIYLADNDSCVVAGQLLTCNVGDIAAGESVDLLIKTRVPADTVEDELDGTLTILNVAEVIYLAETNPANNIVEYRSFVQDEADLRISKYVEPIGQIRAGQVFTYTIFVDNLGPSVARNVVITDTFLSSGRVTIQSCAFSVSQGGGTITQFTCTTGPVVSTQFGTDIGTFRTNHLDPLSPSTQGRLRASFRLVANEPIDTTNTVRTVASTPDPDMSNNFAEVNLEVTAVSDLTLTKTSTGEEQQTGQAGLIFNNAIFGQPFPTAPNYFASTRVTAGRRIEYVLTVTNTGPSAAENVVIRDRLPAGTRLYQGSIVTTGPNPVGCALGTPGEPSDQLTCNVGRLLVGQVATVRFQVITDSTLPAGSVLTNDARVSSDMFDLDNADNIASAANTVLTAADLSVVKTAVGQVATGYLQATGEYQISEIANLVTAGLLLRYQIQVQNNGPSLSRNVTIQDQLPNAPGVEPVTFLYATGADCRPSAIDQQQIFCLVGDLDAGERRTFDVYVSVAEQLAPGTILTNVATALHSGSNTIPPGPPPAIPGLEPTRILTWDPLLTNNSSTNFTTVANVADVSILKEDVPAEARLDKAVEPDDALAGAEHRYRIALRNDGPSTAYGVTVIDTLDLKLPGILGETFLRCEGVDPDTEVQCVPGPGFGQVRLNFYSDDDGNAFNGGVGVMEVGKVYQFYLVVRVDPGYVLDAVDHLATNRVAITTTSTDFNQANNVDIENTRIIAEADLSVTKVDDAAGFLMCDPVQPGGMITYNLTITNAGPSDAAEVFLVDWLPTDVVVADPDQVMVDIERGEVVEVRDDGRITLRVGEDVNNSGVAELGRLNVGATNTATIAVMVRQDAPCGEAGENRVTIETRRNDVLWPAAPDVLPGLAGGPRTPTLDPDLSNNSDTESTTIECPRITVNKTVSYDGTCPGQDITTMNRVGQAVTYCFEITNAGTTYLDTIRLTDTLRTRVTAPTVIFTATITSGGDPKVPVAPGETVTRSVTMPHLLRNWQCGIATDVVEVTANPVNSGRTDLPCLDAVTASDMLAIDIACGGLDWRLQLPVLSVGECEAWVQVQNVGCEDTMAMVVAWGEAGFCPPQAAGPLKLECSGILRPGSAWSFAASQLPNGADSAVVYSFATKQTATPDGGLLPFGRVVCENAFFRIVGDDFAWAEFDSAYRYGRVWRGLDFGTHRGEPLAVSVNRACPDAGDPNVTSHAAYTGISSDMEGVRDPASGSWTFYAPMLFAGKGDLNSILHIQNSGTECTSLEIWFKAQDECLRPILGDVLSLAPGETVHYDVATVVGAGWLGSAWVRATQPLGIIVDTMGPNHFTAYSGLPGNINAVDFSYGDQVNYAPLIYSEYQGWDTALQVQNLSGTVAAKVKVYFLDRSGDIITTLVDWICPRGSQTYFLPVIAALPGSWVGSARAESQEWFTPGGPVIDPPRISTVVLLEKWADPARTSRREAIAYNGQSECLLYDWQIAPGGLGGTGSGSAVFAIPLIAKGYNGITSEIAITNLVPKPGFTDFAMYLYDQNGLLDHYCQKLGHMQVEYIDLASWGVVPNRFLGSMIVSAVFWEHEVWDANGVFQRNLVGLGAVAVERIGGTLGGPDVPGDESKGFEAIPIYDHWCGELPPNCPGVRR